MPTREPRTCTWDPCDRTATFAVEWAAEHYGPTSAGELCLPHVRQRLVDLLNAAGVDADDSLGGPLIGVTVMRLFTPDKVPAVTPDEEAQAWQQVIDDAQAATPTRVWPGAKGSCQPECSWECAHQPVEIPGIDDHAGPTTVTAPVFALPALAAAASVGNPLDGPAGWLVLWLAVGFAFGWATRSALLAIDGARRAHRHQVAASQRPTLQHPDPSTRSTR
jgi:hypothetical protein